MSVLTKDARRTCLSCGAGFESNHGMRSYCFECSPPSGLKSAVKPEPLPVERVEGAFTVGHFREWSSRFQLKDGSQFVLEDWQALVLEDLFARREDGRPLFGQVWLVIPEGNGKTTFVALVVLYTIEHLPESWVPVAAAARDQAVDLTYRIASGFATRNRLSTEYGGPFRLHDGYRKIVHTVSGGVAKIFASNEAGGDGVDFELAVIEELHRHSTMGLLETWAGKLEKSGGQLLLPSTGGEPGGPFEDMREMLRETATDVRTDGCFSRFAGPGAVMHEYALPADSDPEDLELVLQANPFSAITMETLVRKRSAPTWREHHWLRFTCNIPTGDQAFWLPSGAWAACANPDRAVEPGERITLGFDGSYNQDSTALVGCTIEETPHLFVIAVWERPAKTLDWVVPRGEVEMAVHRTMETYHVVEMPADPPGWGRELEEWAERYGSPPVVEYRHNQPKIMAPACEKFYSAVVNGRLTHDGNADLARHVGNTRTKETPDGAYIRKENRSSPRKIDLAVAAVAAFDRVEMNETSGVVYA